jgi:hypothetical protein
MLRAKRSQAPAELQPLAAESMRPASAVTILPLVLKQGDAEDEFPRKLIVPVYYGVSERMASLFDSPPVAGPAPRSLPPEIRAAILTLKAEYPPFHANEIAIICFIFGDDGLRATASSA